MLCCQPGILAPLPPHARYLSFTLRPHADIRAALQQLAQEVDGRATVAGLGEPLINRLGMQVPGLRSFAPPAGAQVELPSTPRALWLWLRGQEPGELLLRARHWKERLAGAFDLASDVPAFVHAGGRDLTGYEDGTENPQGDDAAGTAVVQGQGPGLEGSSFVAVQAWRHVLERFDAMSPSEQDHAIGRRRSDNEEHDDAPPSAHVRRTAQESFAPEAIVLRRSMPWADGGACGLQFVAFGRSFDAFEAQLARMSGAEDGLCDALFGFTQPIDGAYYWCPPLRACAALDLSALGLNT